MSSPHGNRHANSGSLVPSHVRNITHSTPPTPTPTRATTSTRVPAPRQEEEEPALVPALLERSLDASCKNSSFHRYNRNDYAEPQQQQQQQQLQQQQCSHHNKNTLYRDNGNNTDDNSNCLCTNTAGIDTWRENRPTTTTPKSSFDPKTTSPVDTIPTAISPRPSPTPTTLSTSVSAQSTTSISSPLQPSSFSRTTSTTITTHRDRFIRTAILKTPSEASTTSSPTLSLSPMPTSSSSNSNPNNNNNNAYKPTDITAMDGSGIVVGGSNGKRLSISPQLQRLSPGRDAIAGLSGNNSISSYNSGSSAFGMNENATWPGHARSSTGSGSNGVGGHWKPSTSSGLLSSPSSLCRKYEPILKGSDHSEGLTMPLTYLNTSAQQQQTNSGGPNGSGHQQQQPTRSSQPSSPATAPTTVTSTASIFLQQSSSNNNTEMDTFSETHSGVIMAFPSNNTNNSSPRASNTAATGPGCLGMGDFVRSLFSQSLVSRLYSHRPRFSGVSVGTPSWSVMRVFNTCHLLYLIPVTTITIARLVTIDMICNEQLYSWLTVQAFLFLSQIVSTCNILQRQNMMMSSSRANGMDQRTRIMLLVFMVWTVIGVGFLGSDNNNAQDPCSTMNDPIYCLSFKIIIFHVSMIGFYFLPCSSLLLTRVLPNSISSGLTRTATKPMIDKLGSTPMVEGMFGGDAEEATCAICLGDYKPDETIRFLPCQHHFHLECVDQWLATDKSCPLCKHDIDKPMEILHSRRNTVTLACNPHSSTHNNSDGDDTHRNHNNAGPSHGGSSGTGNNSIGLDGFQVIIV